MINLLSDFTFWTYSVSFILAAYGFSLFAWWWWKIGKTTEIYVYITLLFLSDAILFGGNFHGRVLKYIDPKAAVEMLDSWAWALRSLLHIVITTLIICRMTRRVMRTRKYVEGKKLDRRECPDADVSNQPGSGLDDKK